MCRRAMIGIFAVLLSMTVVAASGQIACIGDCDGDGSVTIDEIVRVVNAVLDGDVSRCPAGDRDADGTVTVDEVLTAVTNALLGCPNGPLPGPDLTRLYPAPRLLVGDQPRSMTVADVDGDGDVDIVSADQASRALSLLIQNRNGGFEPPRRIPTGNGPVAVISVALDDDSLPDFVVANAISNSVSVALSRNDYGTSAEVGVGVQPVAVAAGDFNDDAFSDVVVASLGSISLLTSNGDGSLSEDQRLDAGGDPSSIAVADLDGDSHLDLVAAIGLDGVSIRRGAAERTFADPELIALPLDAEIIGLADVNEDEVVDILVLGTPPVPMVHSSVAVLLGNGDGSFADPQLVDTGATSISLALADIDGDDNVDILTGNNGSVSILLGKGDGTFLEPNLSTINGIAAALVAADFDADGMLDVGYADILGNAVSILWGLGEGLLAAEAVVPVDGMSPMQVLTADLDGDTAPDLLTTNILSEDVSILLNEGDTGLSSPLVVATEAGLLVAAVGDIDNAGGPDLVTAHEHSECLDCLLVFEGLGDGGFERRQRLVSRARVMSLEIADFEGDGIGDVVALNSASVSLFPGLGAWTFESERQFAAGSQPQALAVGDLNGDLLPDVAVADAGSKSAGVMFSTGVGGFDVPVFLSLSLNPARIRIADVNADGFTDVLVQGGDRFSWVPGEGSGTFGSERRLDGIAGGTFDIADVNGDGLPDLVTLIEGVTIYPGLAGGPFGARQRFAVNPFAVGIIAIDLNGDDIAELVTSNASFDGTVSVLAGR